MEDWNDRGEGKTARQTKILIPLPRCPSVEQKHLPHIQQWWQTLPHRRLLWCSQLSIPGTSHPSSSRLARRVQAAINNTDINQVSKKEKCNLKIGPLGLKVTTDQRGQFSLFRSFYARFDGRANWLSALFLSRAATIVMNTRAFVLRAWESEILSSFSNRCPRLGIVSDLAYLASSRSARSLSRSSPQMMLFLQPHAYNALLSSRALWSFGRVVVVMVEKESPCLYFPSLTSV